MKSEWQLSACNSQQVNIENMLYNWSYSIFIPRKRRNSTLQEKKQGNGNIHIILLCSDISEEQFKCVIPKLLWLSALIRDVHRKNMKYMHDEVDRRFYQVFLFT